MDGPQGGVANETKEKAYLSTGTRYAKRYRVNCIIRYPGFPSSLNGGSSAVDREGSDP